MKKAYETPRIDTESFAIEALRTLTCTCPDGQSFFSAKKGTSNPLIVCSCVLPCSAVTKPNQS